MSQPTHYVHTEKNTGVCVRMCDAWVCDTVCQVCRACAATLWRAFVCVQVCPTIMNGTCVCQLSVVCAWLAVYNMLIHACMFQLCECLCVCVCACVQYVCVMVCDSASAHVSDVPGCIVYYDSMRKFVLYACVRVCVLCVHLCYVCMYHDVCMCVRECLCAMSVYVCAHLCATECVALRARPYVSVECMCASVCARTATACGLERLDNDGELFL
jgi:hypothetical protein